MYRKVGLFIMFLSQIQFSISQGLNDETTTKDFKRNVFILASDSLAGRESGTEGEIKAAKFISSEFEKYGVKPFVGDTSYYQNFLLSSDYYYGKINFLKVNNGEEIKPGKLYQISAYSSNAQVEGKLIDVGYGINADSLPVDLSNNIAIIRVTIPDELAIKYSKNNLLLETRIKNLEQRSAKGIVLLILPNYNGNRIFSFNKVKPRSIPVITITEKNATSINLISGNPIALSTDVIRETIFAKNVVGYIGNNASKTIVIGAHYDHLGLGNFGSRSSERTIHYGADDNASGTTMVLELAKYLSTNGNKKFNYVLIAFAAEEKGLLGSNYFVKSDLFKNIGVTYMINFDMVGRLGCIGNKTIIIGTGTSNAWKSILKETKSNDYKTKKIKAGPEFSDHANFYKKNIPYIYFTTGLHKEYHKPLDTPQSLNYDGMTQIFNNVVKVIDKTAEFDYIPFKQTTSWQMTNAYLFFVKMLIF
ncbi:MAG: M28 family peptidase [Bacteroidota bacterium]